MKQIHDDELHIMLRVIILVCLVLSLIVSCAVGVMVLQAAGAAQR